MHCFAEQWKYCKIFSRRKYLKKKIINNSFLNELLLVTLLATWNFSNSWASTSFQHWAEYLHAPVFPEIKFGVFVLGVFKSLLSQERQGVLGDLPSQPQVDSTSWFANILDLPRGWEISKSYSLRKLKQINAKTKILKRVIKKVYLAKWIIQLVHSRVQWVSGLYRDHKGWTQPHKPGNNNTPATAVCKTAALTSANTSSALIYPLGEAAPSKFGF